jgi:hypothetical protein
MVDIEMPPPSHDDALIFNGIVFISAEILWKAQAELAKVKAERDAAIKTGEMLTEGCQRGMKERDALAAALMKARSILCVLTDQYNFYGTRKLRSTPCWARRTT